MRYERPDWVRRVNAMGAAPVGGPAAMVSLDADALLEAARAATSLDDFGPPEWEEPFRRLVDALEREAQLSVVGRLMTRHDVLRHLCTRLVLVDAHRRDPAIADEVVAAPVVVTGPARSGTSILHELLAEDPTLRAPRGYEMAYPTLDSEHRPGWAEAEFDLWGDVQPEFRAVHELTAHLPEECLWLMAPEFDLGFWSTCVDVPSFAGWRALTDPLPTYRFHRSFLQVLQHGGAAATWVLKSPVHLSRLHALFAVYPDARVIRTHRDPARVMPSTVSTVATGRWLRSDAVDPLAVAGSVVLGMTALLNQAAQERDAFPSGQVADLHYVDLMRDPCGAIARACDDIGVQLAPQTPDRIRGYLDRRPSTKYGVHRYSLEQFGLDADVVRRDLAAYVDAFEVESEASR